MSNDIQHVTDYYSSRCLHQSHINSRKHMEVSKAHFSSANVLFLTKKLNGKLLFVSKYIWQYFNKQSVWHLRDISFKHHLSQNSQTGKKLPCTLKIGWLTLNSSNWWKRTLWPMTCSYPEFSQLGTTRKMEIVKSHFWKR